MQAEGKAIIAALHSMPADPVEHEALIARANKLIGTLLDNPSDANLAVVKDIISAWNDADPNNTQALIRLIELLIAHMNSFERNFEFPGTAFYIGLQVSFSLIWISLALIVAAFFPKSLRVAGIFVTQDIVKTSASGVVWEIACWLAIAILLAASLLLIGLPFLALLTLVQWAIWLFGSTAIFYRVGKAICSRFSAGSEFYYLAVLVGGVVFELVGFMPLAGCLFSCLVCIYSSGVTWRFLLERRFHQSAV